jgi:uncharacterized protein
VSRRDSRAFLVELGALSAPGTRRAVVLEGTIAGLELETARVGVPEDELVRFVGVLEAVHDGILVTGTVEAHWRASCRRCLEPAEGILSAEVCELCVEHGDEETTYHLGHEQLDVEPIAHDACILALPLAPLCRPDCLGLCPQCGANRNCEPCGCTVAPDPRWSALRLLVGGDDSSVAG